MYFEVCRAIFRRAGIWQRTCTWFGIAREGNLRFREKKMAKKSAVKKGSKMGSVKPLKTPIVK